MTLRIDLQDGFADDHVTIRVNGIERFRSEDVSTMLLVGMATSFEIEVEPGEVEVAVSVGSRGIEDTLRLELDADTYVGISLRDEAIETVVSDQPFGYG